MNVLILTSEQYSTWIWNRLEDILGRNDVHCYYADEPYPFHALGNYDVGISFMYTYKVPAKEVNTHPWINFHPGPLPEYKGRNLCYHAIMNGEKVFGATVHYMDENFDTGPIIDVLYFPVEDWMTAGDLHEQVIEASKKLFVRHFMAIVLGVKLHSYENTGGTYYQKMPIQGEIYLDDETKRQIRAITCYPYVPRVYIGGKMYKIVRCE